MELIIKAKDIRLEYTGRDVLDIDGLELYDYDRIGLVRANGAGKSTSLKVLMGELTPPGCKINHLGKFAYIPQLDEVTLQEVKDFALMGKLNVEQLEVQTISGGVEARFKIAQALSEQVRGILADAHEAMFFFFEKRGPFFCAPRMSASSFATLFRFFPATGRCFSPCILFPTLIRLPNRPTGDCF